MAFQILQVTLGAGATQAAPVSNPNFPRKQIQFAVIQNNSGATARMGDNTVSATKGIVIGATPVILNPPLQYGIYLEELWFFGTAANVIDILYVE